MSTEVMLAILGVLATLVAAVIQRPWQRKRHTLPKHEPMEFGAIQERGSFAVEDVVKMLDLDRVPPALGAPGTAGVTDSYLLRRDMPEGNGVVFRYGSNGGLTGRCVSHSDRHVVAKYNSDHYPTSLAITVALDQLAVGTRARVTNQMTFTGAFDRAGQEDFETHIERPTRSLSMIVKFSRHRPCKMARGQFQIGERGAVQAMIESGPVLIQNGLLLYWRILPTRGDWLPIGARYQLVWTWEDAVDDEMSTAERRGETTG